MSQFLPSLESEIQSRGLLPRGQKILVAVSGGADSLVLLHALHALAAENYWQLSVAHFNHQLRGRASDADEKLVRRTAAVLKLPAAIERADVKAFAKQSKFSIEMAARKLRHEFFARTAKLQKFSVVALAHHADDQVELFFLRVLRGAGGEGLAGMKWSSPSPADKKITLVRPLLALTKAELLGFAHENRIRFREDATNASADFLRNRVRHELIPLLQRKYQPGLAKTVLRLMEIVGAESELVSEAARQWLERNSEKRKVEGGKKSAIPIPDAGAPSTVSASFKPKPAASRDGARRSDRVRAARPGPMPWSSPHAAADAFEKLPVAVQRKILQRQLTELGVAADFELIEPLRKTPGKLVSVSAGWAVARDAAGKVQLQEQFEERFQAGKLEWKLQGRAGHGKFGGKEFFWHLRRMKNVIRPQNKTGVEVFDSDQVGSEIILRHWRAGDRFQPLGLPSPVKLQNLFVNAKIPRARRRELVVAATLAGEIFWVEELRMSERFKLTAVTRRQLVWRWG